MQRRSLTFLAKDTMRHEAISVDSPSSPSGLTFRHVATLLLLLITVPVFALSAVVTLPLMVAAAAVEAVRQLLLVEARPHDPAPF